MKKQTPETGLVKAILALCAYYRVPAYRIGTGSFALTDPNGGRRYFRGGAKGFPDLVLLTEAGAVFVEAKSATGRLTHEQAEFRMACTACAPPFAVHHVVGGLDSVIAYLVHLGLLKAEQVAHYRLTEAALDFTSPTRRGQPDTEQGAA